MTKIKQRFDKVVGSGGKGLELFFEEYTQSQLGGQK